MARFDALKATFVLGLAAVPAWTQDQVRTVPPGREVREGKLLTPGLTDTWNLKVAEDEILWCVVESSAFDPVLDLVDEHGKQLGTNDGKGTRSELWLSMPASGSVEFRVRPYQGSGGGQYSFWLQRFKTQRITCGAELSHRFGKAGWWHYRLTLNKGTVIVPTVIGDGQVKAAFDLARKNMPGVLGGYLALHDGEYIVRVQGRAKHSHQFFSCLARQLTLEESHQADDETNAHGLDVYRTALKRGESYVFDLAMSDAQCGLDVREQNPVADRPGYVWTGAIEKGGRYRRWYTARHDCVMEILLRNQNPRNAPYRIAITRVRATVDPARPVRARLEVGGGDQYLLPEVTGQLLRISVVSDTFDPQIDVLDPSGNLLSKSDDRGVLDRNTLHTFLAARPGRYRLLIFTPGGVGGGDYTLRAEPIPVAEVSATSPRTLAVTRQVSAHAYAQLVQNQEVWFSVRSHMVDSALTVIAPDGTVLGTFESGGRGGDVLTAFVPKQSGRYTLQVHARSGDGDCRLSLVSPSGM